VHPFRLNAVDKKIDSLGSFLICLSDFITFKFEIFFFVIPNWRLINKSSLPRFHRNKILCKKKRVYFFSIDPRWRKETSKEYITHIFHAVNLICIVCNRLWWERTTNEILGNLIRKLLSQLVGGGCWEWGGEEWGRINIHWYT